MHHSIFEPLCSLQQSHMGDSQAAQPFMASFSSQASLQQQAPAASWFTLSPSSPSTCSYIFNRENAPFSSDQPPLSCKTDLSKLYNATPCSMQSSMITSSPFSSFNKKARSEQDLASHLKLPLLPPTETPTCSDISDDGGEDDRKGGGDDDGSVASKLLSSITKSISSPSLQLSSCKESARETPYQKTLRLKQMKLQHCAEALGMESSDAPSIYDNQCIHQENHDLIGNPSSSCPPSITFPKPHQESSIMPGKSAPTNLSSPHSMVNHSRYMRCTSFPPPLSHTLPVSSSCDSLSLSLRPHRQDGRFILTEVMVPSKHYFHANRRDGRLTLHVFTRDEDEENFANQYEEEAPSINGPLSNELVDVKEELIVVSMESVEEGFSTKELIGNTDIIQSSDHEEVCEKDSVDIGEVSMDDFKEFTIAASNVMSLERLHCIAAAGDGAAGDDGNIAETDDERNDESNVISNVVTLSLQSTSDHSRITVHKAHLKQSTLRQSHGLLSSHHDISTFSQSKENFIWESNLMPCVAAASHLQSIQRGGCGGGSTPAFVLEEISAKSLIKVVSELATSLIVEASFGRGNWCLAGKRKLSANGVLDSEGNNTIIGACNAMNCAIMSGGNIQGHEDRVNHGGVKTTPGYCNIHDDEIGSSTEGGKEIATSPALHFDLQLPSSSSSNLQWDEWLHTLHCKELYDRHQLGRSFMKLHCIATRS
eukprot:c21959_g1_i1 orf=244-2370(+)